MNEKEGVWLRGLEEPFKWKGMKGSAFCKLQIQR